MFCRDFSEATPKWPREQQHERELGRPQELEEEAGMSADAKNSNAVPLQLMSGYTFHRYGIALKHNIVCNLMGHHRPYDRGRLLINNFVTIGLF